MDDRLMTEAVTRARILLLVLLALLISGCQVFGQPPAPALEPTQAKAFQPEPTIPPPTADLSASTSAKAVARPEVHRIQVREVGGAAEFYDTVTGDTFVPRGANYLDVREVVPGQLWEDYVFGAGSFRPDLVREAFHNLADHGYNTVRLHFDLCARGPSCIGRPVGTGLNPKFLDHMAVVMNIAAAEGLHLVMAASRVPLDGLYWERFRVHYSFEEGLASLGALEDNGYFLHPAGVAMQEQYWRDLMSDLALRKAPFEVVLGWELHSEFWLQADKPPLSLQRTQVSLPGRERYDLSDPLAKRQLVADATLAWIGALTAVIRQADPDALVGVGFAPSALQAPQASTRRYADLEPLLEAASLDFLDLILPEVDRDLEPYADVLLSPVWQARPAIVGELTVLRSDAPSLDIAAVRAQEWIAQSCTYGLDGWLLWEYHDRQEPEGAWGMLSGEDELLRALAPAHQPDPCITTPLPVYNLALGRPVTASSSEPETPPEQAVDGTGAIWRAAGDPPQWIEVDLGEPRTVGSLRFVVAQELEGQTHHRVWAVLDDGSRVHLAELQGPTTHGQVLEPVLLAPQPGVRAIRVETLESPSRVAWRELEVRAAPGPE